MIRTRLLIAVVVVTWMLSVPAGVGGAAVAAPTDAAGPTDAATFDVADGTVFQKTPCEIDGDPDSDCTCDGDLDPSPWCDDSPSLQ